MTSKKGTKFAKRESIKQMDIKQIVLSWDEGVFRLDLSWNTDNIVSPMFSCTDFDSLGFNTSIVLLNSQVVSIWLNQIILSCPSLETYPSFFLCRLIGLLIQCLLNKCIDKDRCFCLVTMCWGCYMDLQVNHVWMCKRSSNRPKEKVPSTCALLSKWITIVWIQYLIQFRYFTDYFYFLKKITIDA